MKFRDYFTIPQNLLMVPAGTLERINAIASRQAGVVTFYFPMPRRYPLHGQTRYMTVHTMMDYDIDRDRVVKLYPFRKVKVKGETPPPDPKALQDREYITSDCLPPPVRDMLREKCNYWKTRSKHI